MLELSFEKDIPQYMKKECCRTSKKLPLYLPSEAYKAHMQDREMELDQREAKLQGLGDELVEHPVWQQALEDGSEALVRPIALYSDGVQYTKQENFLGVSVCDLLTGLSFVVAILRSSL